MGDSRVLRRALGHGFGFSDSSGQLHRGRILPRPRDGHDSLHDDNKLNQLPS